MSNIVDITSKIDEKNKKELDMAASIAIMKKDLQMLEFNNLPELKNLKAIMRRTIKDLSEKIRNG